MSGFNKFQEKKAKQISDKKTSGTLKKISSLISKPSHNARRSDFTPDPNLDRTELDKVDQEYMESFGDLKSGILNDIRKQIKNFTTTILTVDKPIDELSEVVQNSYKVSF